MITRRTLMATSLAAAMVPSASLALDPIFKPQKVRIRSDIAPGQLFVMPRAHFLYYVETEGAAMRYGVGVGKAGLEFTGEAVIQYKRKWPDWRPTDEMIERNPSAYSRFIEDDKYRQPGGPKNPLGARALYLYQNGKDTYFRIHGTTQPSSIGRSVSNGCIRMINEHVEDLYDRVPSGAKVTVI